MATSSYYDLLLAASGPSMTVTSRWIDQQRERTLPVRSAFSAIGLPSVTCVRTVSPNSLRCDEEVAAPDSPSRCDVNVPLGVVRPHQLLVLGLTPCLMRRRVHSPVHRPRCQVLMWQAYSIV